MSEQRLLPDILDVPDAVTQLQRGDVHVTFDEQAVTIRQGGRAVTIHLEHDDETGIFLAPHDDGGTMLSLTHDKVTHLCAMNTADEDDCALARTHLREKHGINYTPNW